MNPCVSYSSITSRYLTFLNRKETMTGGADQFEAFLGMFNFSSLSRPAGMITTAEQSFLLQRANVADGHLFPAEIRVSQISVHGLSRIVWIVERRSGRRRCAIG